MIIIAVGILIIVTVLLLWGLVAESRRREQNRNEAKS